MNVVRLCWLAVMVNLIPGAPMAANLLAGAEPVAESRTPVSDHAVQALRLAINDLIATYGEKYPQGRDFLARLKALEPDVRSGGAEATRQFKTLQREALLANPALCFEKLLVVRRTHVRPPAKVANNGPRPWLTHWAGMELGLPSNHECNQSVRHLGWDNQIATISLKRPQSEVSIVFRPSDGGWIGEVKLHWDGQRMLFSRADRDNWKIWEVNADGTALRLKSEALLLGIQDNRKFHRDGFGLLGLVRPKTLTAGKPVRFSVEITAGFLYPCCGPQALPTSASLSHRPMGLQSLTLRLGILE